MVNIVWLLLIVGGLCMSALHHSMVSVTQVIVSGSEKAVEVAFGFVGIMALWLGMAKIAEESGLMRAFSRLLTPFVSRLFPGIPKDHPAMGNMLMNMAANILGMGGAATPFGLKAMEELQKLNPVKDTASANMITFLAINTASINLIPATVIALRVAAGSKNPTEIVGPTILATTVASIVAISAERIFRHCHRSDKR
ncbi:MAG: nucleoside recognition protein [Firmicutes bacterium]|jgi:spore maturation protein A|uniref:Nucleoside recognition protein n=1 Tax=Sulfobacillus benefaciens TaxID=453960 RepID=A0A2T2XBE6_9FIRM|nr:nucleoside recognition protein [Bacillota bacterium]MCL5015773.1 nucleoside recognition protein [Bacillota bacterium]PSR31766.1 MAG: nucleoside recognition protein [Sulfobacillus benefaciens]